MDPMGYNDLTLVLTNMLALMTFQLMTELCIIEFCFPEQCGHSSCCFALDSRLVDCRLAFEMVQEGNHDKVELTEPHPTHPFVCSIYSNNGSVGKCIPKKVTTRINFFGKFPVLSIEKNNIFRLTT